MKFNGVLHRRDLIDGNAEVMVQMADRKKLAGAHDSFVRRAIRVATDEAKLSRQVCPFPRSLRVCAHASLPSGSG